ncbi:hypothetical protein [Hasllibacter sp. MH4015]|uniref:hypothetical protein n=1 Tax=Hasllibacter sp. MH4015 TaxID=2854029 RepID=UPI001CD577B9|nr:hypothetical protein [Hasllibacter sp. MH4015]
MSPLKQAAIFAAIAVVLFVFVNLAAVLFWVALGLVYVLWRWRAWAGALALVLVLAAVSVPPMFDQRILDRQLTAARNMNVDAAPIDLTGRTVLVMGSGPYAPVDCSVLCYALFNHSGAEAVYFGYDRSLAFIPGDATRVDFTQRRIFTFPDGVPSSFPTQATPVEVTPERIDYVVLDGLTDWDGDALIEEIGTYGFYALSHARRSVRVYETSEPLALNLETDELVFSRLMIARNRLGFPYIPGVPAGRYASFETGSAHGAYYDDNLIDAALFLCGPRAEACRAAMQ